MKDTVKITEEIIKHYEKSEHDSISIHRDIKNETAILNNLITNNYKHDSKHLISVFEDEKLSDHLREFAKYLYSIIILSKRLESNIESRYLDEMEDKINV